MRARLALIGVMVCMWAMVFTQAGLAQGGKSGQGRDDAFEAELLQRLGQINPQAVPFFQEATRNVDTHTQLDNLYALPEVEADDAKQQFEEKLKGTLERKTSSYDSHPSYQERIELVKQIQGAAGSYGSTQPMWDLIRHADLLQSEMTELIQKRITAG
jgi:hypothetical protein